MISFSFRFSFLSQQDEYKTKQSHLISIPAANRSRLLPWQTHSTLCSLSNLSHKYSPKNDFAANSFANSPLSEQAFSTPGTKPGNHWSSCYFSFVIGQALKNTSHLIRHSQNIGRKR
jgi:hypothetical protein